LAIGTYNILHPAKYLPKSMWDTLPKRERGIAKDPENPTMIQMGARDAQNYGIDIY